MDEASKKLRLTGEILKIENDALLDEVETVINRNKTTAKVDKSFKDFSGIWTAAEADEMKRIVEESCEQIDPVDWK